MQQSCISFVLILVLIARIESLTHAQNALRNDSDIFPGLKVVDQFSSTSFNKQQQAHVCIFDCYFFIPFNEPLILPSNCEQRLTSNACEIDIQVNFNMEIIVFFFWNETIDLVVDDVRLDSVSADVSGFEFESDALSTLVQYKCSYGDRCEWNYIIEKIPRILATDYHLLYQLSSSLIYHSNSQASGHQCYSSDQLINCTTGLCGFSQFLDPELLTLVRLRQCLLFETPKLYFGQYRYYPGPTIYDFDYFYFVCNFNECNSPMNEAEIKNLISRITTNTTSSATAAHDLINAVLLSFIAIIHVILIAFAFAVPFH